MTDSLTEYEFASRSLVPVELIGGHGLVVVHTPSPVHGGLSQGARHLPHMDRHGAAARADVVDPERFRLGRVGAHRATGKDEGLRLVRAFLRGREVRYLRRRAV